MFSSSRRTSQLTFPRGLHEKIRVLFAEVFRAIILAFGHKVPVMGAGLVWSWTKQGARWLDTGRGLMHELSQNPKFQDAGCLHSMFEKLPYFWCFEGLFSTIFNEASMSITQNRPAQFNQVLEDENIKLAMCWTGMRLARGYNVLDVEISRGSWRNREGAHVRKSVGPFAQLLSELEQDSVRLLRASPGLYIFADMAALAVPKYRGVYASTEAERKLALQRLVLVFEFLEKCQLGVVQHADGKWPVFCKTSKPRLLPEAVKRLEEWGVPSFSFETLLESSVNLAAEESCNRSPNLAKVPAAENDGSWQIAGHGIRESQQGPAGKPGSAAASIRMPGKRQQHGAPAGSAQAATDGAKPSDRRVASLDAEPSQDGGEWEEIFHGPPSRLVHTYTELRNEVEAVLGRNKDPGLYEMKDRGSNSSGRCLKGTCSPTSCIGCSRQITASLQRTEQQTVLIIRARGQHGKLVKPAGQKLWNVAEQYVLEEAFRNKEPISAASIRAAFAKAGLAVRCTPRQLTQYVDRAKSKTRQRSAKQGLSIAELNNAAQEFRNDTSADWSALPLNQLVVLPGFTISEERVCVIWTSRGMVERARHGQKHCLKLVVDGKQKLLVNQYSVVTLSFLVPNPSTSATWAGPGR